MQHVEGCKCMTCQWMSQGMTEEQAFQKFREWEIEQITKHGWLVHFCEDAHYLTGANYHTHGMKENLGHPDLQIVVPLPAKVAHNIISNVVDRVKDGEKFEDGDVAEGIIKGYKVKFINGVECDRDVLRIVLPDPKGNLEREDMEGLYPMQYEDNQELTEEEVAEITAQREADEKEDEEFDDDE